MRVTGHTHGYEPLPSEKGTGIVIATVRIAPVERWCKKLRQNAKANPEMLNFVGMKVQIEPNSMTMNDSLHDDYCRWWRISVKSKAKLESLMPRLAGTNNRSVCEHMLEMD